jgi:tRNA-splicing ligase RtcB
MSPSTVQSSNVPIRLWTRIEEVESAALDQLRNIAALPWAHHHVAAMPDVHLGKGATVGSVIALKGAVSPAAVGVDIGCGMAAVRTNLRAEDLPDDLGAVRSAVEAAIPVGFSMHGEPVRGVDKQQLWDEYADLAPIARGRVEKAVRQMGTLGGGNHFVELCLDADGEVWLMLHSGSRNIGKELAEHHMQVARGLPHNTGLPDRDLAVFLADTPEMTAYRRDLFWAQRYAALNRATMLALYRDVVQRFFPHVTFDEPISCHHNYVAEEHHYGADVLVTRKGAIRAGAGELGIIPGSMGTRSYIVRGLGNPESFESASHGAGRRMSRSKARKMFTADDVVTQTAGVECRKDVGVVDEIPAAYKPIEQVMADQADLVEVVAELRQVLCVKG